MKKELEKFVYETPSVEAVGVKIETSFMSMTLPEPATFDDGDW